MSKVSTLARHARELLVAMLFAALVLVASGCGSSSASPPVGDAPPPVVPPPPPAAIEGVATPTSVAVVTATNAQ
ncbi:MAG: hypothetical protein ABI769_00520 [Pseudomonadota bacterium]